MMIKPFRRLQFSPTTIQLFATGLISILDQVVLLRELSVAFFGSELIYILSLGLWLFWTAVGAWLQKYLARPSLKKVAIIISLTGPILLLDVAFIRGSRCLFGGIPGAYLPFMAQIFITASALFPISFLTGLLFSWTAKLFLAENPQQNTPGAAYALESMGGLMGGLLATLALKWGVQNIQMTVCLAFLSLLMPFVPGMLPEKSRIKRGYFPVVLGALFLTAWMWPMTALDIWTTRWNHPHVIASRDTSYGRVTLSGLSGQISLFENDILSYETDGTEAEAFVHPAALQHPEPKHILVLGGGAEGLLRELLRHRPERIDYVELNPEMLKMAVGHLPRTIQESLSDPRVRIIFGDPRQFLKGSGNYDLILVGMPEPLSGQANRFYSRDFFLHCAARLYPRGILGLRLKTAENFWAPPVMLRMGSIFQALRTVFPECVFLPGTMTVITASFSALPVSSEIPLYRWHNRKIAGQLINPPYLSYLYGNDRFPNLRHRMENTTAPVNTDIRPVCYQFSVMNWLAKFFPYLNTMTLYNPFHAGNREGRLPYLILFGLTLLSFSLCRPFPHVRRLMLMAIAGFVGMVSETILLLHYQVKQGILYQDIGILLMSFMAGLTLGAVSISRQKPRRAWGYGLAGGFFILTVLIYGNILTNRFPGLAPAMVLLCLSGFLVSALFVFISVFEVADPSKIISPLYTADLLGGCLGSLASGLLLIPFFGLDITAALMIIIHASLLMLVV